MSATAPRRARPAVTRATLAASALAIAVLASMATFDAASASPTSTAATTTTAAAASSTTRPAATSSSVAAGTTAVPTTTEAGPAPRGSQRVAATVDIEKIRPTSLPVRSIVITTALAIAVLAIAGFVYGKLRSRPPGTRARRPAIAADRPTPAPDATPVGSPPLVAPPPTLPPPQTQPLPPPEAQPLPPPEAVSEWAPPKA
jgi:hypothetical protein